MANGRLRRLRRRQPLLRGDGRLHAPPDRRHGRRARARGRRSTASSAWSSTTRCSGSSRTRRSIRSRGPACLDEYFRGKRAGDSIRDAFGDLEPINPAYRDPEARLALMDRQRLAGCFLFPTLGVGVEEALLHDSRRAARRVPRVQRVDARRLDVQLQGPHLRGAVHLPAGSRHARFGRSTGRSSTARTSS